MSSSLFLLLLNKRVAWRYEETKYCLILEEDRRRGHWRMLGTFSKSFVLALC